MTSTDEATPRAVIYARISRDKAGGGLGVGKQESDCRELAERLGLDVVAVRTDNDLTAYTGSKRSKGRPGYKALLADIRDGRAQAVIAWHTDRLHRDMTELEGYITACGEGSDGIPTYTVRGSQLHLDTASGRMIARILGAVARQEVEHMIERQKSAKERARKAGTRTGGSRPFGYRLDHESSLVIDEHEALAVRDGYRRLLAGEGCYTIAKSWNQGGYRTPVAGDRGGGNVWQQVTVRQLLNRAVNAGLIEHDGKIVGKGRWDPIVDEDTWRTARAILSDKSRRSTPGPKPRHLLTGVLICGVCGNTRFAAHPGGTGGRPMYTCFVDKPGIARKACVARDQAKLDAYVEAIITERLSRPDVATAFAKPGEDVAALDARRTALNAQLRDWATQPGITPQQVAIASAPLLGELQAVEERITAALRAPELGEFTGDDVDAAKVWEGLTIERKRAIARILLRVRLLPQAGLKMPPGWRIGMPRPLREEAIEIEWCQP